MALTVRDFTGGELEGSGLFEELMRAANSHLLAEFSKGRIASTDYANVYLNSLTVSMQGAAQYLLAYPKVNKELEVMDEQIIQAQKQNELIDLQKAQLVIENATSQYNLDFMLPKQLEKITSDIALTTKQGLLLDEQISTEQKKQLQLVAQTSLSAKQEELVDEQILVSSYQYTDPIAGTLFAQLTKTQKEIDILSQKKVTELAQTVGDETTVFGLVGKELELKKNQADSFIRDAEQKVAKLYADAFQIIHSISPDAGAGTTSDPGVWGISGLDGVDIFTKLKSGII